ncbi:hypothetical protein J8281_16065 [Aquimarina sp. U1-2]|uniref:hypothetical protein n=1 Tax=Aquimarina sp. U1-2 TaxID=2823141 RepID=UPI001AECBFE1|nr:hypothetical protein [Aquimarina sp. U1-2]MBP2833711.1 hypothetical protein [Aquimarina sp. U1-2]
MRNLNILSLIILLSLFLISCQEPNIQSEYILSTTDINAKVVRARRATNNVSFDVPTQQISSRNDIEVLFKNQIYGWDTGFTAIQGQKLKVTMPKNHHLSDNNSNPFDDGLRCRINVPERDGYELQFDVIFQSNFSFSGGGKVGFGFVVGKGVSGRDTAAIRDMQGGSFRVVWDLQNDNHYLCPYVYYQDMRNENGRDFISHRFPLEARKRYTIRLRIQSNTSGNSADGYGKMEISTNFGRTFQTVWEKDDMRWSGNSNPYFRNIRQFYFQNFRGGKGEQYDGDRGNQSVYFDNLNWKPFRFR